MNSLICCLVQIQKKRFNEQMMQTITKKLVILAIVAWGQSICAAADLYKTATYVDQEYWFLDENGIKDLSTAPLIDVDKSIAGTFDISLGATSNEIYDKVGYDPQKEVITAVEVLFAAGGELVEISLGGGDLGAAYVNQDSLDGLLGGDQYIHEFIESGITGSLLLTLVDTGQLDWSVSIGAGDEAVRLYAVSLAVQTRPRIHVGEFGRSIPIPVHPSDPFDPSDPVDPSEPFVPSGPVDPLNPFDSSIPSGPVDPSDPFVPADPVDPLNPFDSSTPSGPVDPSDPFVPSGPVDPLNPFDSSIPSGPVDPSDPFVPSGPVDPLNPSTPSDPFDPLNPFDPSTPSGPVDPLEPFVPSAPSGPFFELASVPSAPQSVPDSGATIVLFGACLIGLLSLRRRFAS